ncbi:hypothetical protein [Pseudopedobacter beijingensis]|uniref:Uncharacterized protein n=1 Tax=Pseudopedobacter beijingensis TaxID=1207056 RepID=A0ABW4IE35_9SPHI
MKSIKLLLFISLTTFAIMSCKKNDSDAKDEETQSEYYLTYKVNGTTVTSTEFTALRGNEGDNKTFTLLASGKDNANPKFKFYFVENFIGIVPGLTIGADQTSGSSYLEYTNNTGLLFSTENDSEGGSLALFDVTYKKDGVVSGIFHGYVTSKNNDRVEITEGKFKVKFSN